MNRRLVRNSNAEPDRRVGRAVRAWIEEREDEERDTFLRALGSGDMRLP